MLGCGTQIFIMVFFTLGEIDLMYFSMASKELYTFSFALLGMFFPLWMRFQSLASYPGSLSVPTQSGERRDERMMTCLRIQHSNLDPSPTTFLYLCLSLFHCIFAHVMDWFFSPQLHVCINSILSFLTKVLSHWLNLLLFLFSVCLSWIPFTCKPWSIDDLFIGELLPNILGEKKQKSSKLNVHVMP